jgi:integrase, catalytic domain protein
LRKNLKKQAKRHNKSYPKEMVQHQMAAFIAKSKITDLRDCLFIVIDDNSQKLYVAI